jgi:hypothetical protein
MSAESEEWAVVRTGIWCVIAMTYVATLVIGLIAAGLIMAVGIR